MKSGESGENCSVSEKKTFKNYTILMYIAQGQGQKTPGDKILIRILKFYNLNHTLHQPLVFNTY